MADESRILLTHEQASRLFGVAPKTLGRRIKAAGIEIYLDPGDLRKRLVLKEDLDRVFHIRLVDDQSQENNDD